MNNTTFSVPAHFYCGLMGEAIVSIVRADLLRSECARLESEGDDSQHPYNLLVDAGIHARYGFLLACNALENSAYAVLANSNKLSQSLLEDIDRLSVINKFEVFALLNGAILDRGDERYAKLKQVIRCRNDFVHPKPVPIEIIPGEGKAIGRAAGNREYPIAFDSIEIDHVAEMIADILRFTAWVVFDLTKHPAAEGARLINGGMTWWMAADFHDAETKWQYDLRSLGGLSQPLSKKRRGKRSR